MEYDLDAVIDGLTKNAITFAVTNVMAFITSKAPFLTFGPFGIVLGFLLTKAFTLGAKYGDLFAFAVRINSLTETQRIEYARAQEDLDDALTPEDRAVAESIVTTRARDFLKWTH